MTTDVCEPVVPAMPPAFSVVEVRRWISPQTELAVFTGETSPKGRLRCRVILHRVRGREFFSVSPKRIVRVVAPSLADLDNRRRA